VDINASSDEDDDNMSGDEGEDGDSQDEGEGDDQSEVSKTESELAREEEEKKEAAEALRDIYDELRGKKALLTVKQFQGWEDVTNLLDANVLTAEDFNSMLSDVLFGRNEEDEDEEEGQGVKVVKKTETMTFEQFQVGLLIQLID
jgi:hypothetical protein